MTKPNWYVDLDEHEEQKDELADDAILGYIVFTITSGVCSTTQSSLFTTEQVVEKALQIVRDKHKSTIETFPDWEEVENEELARREARIAAHTAFDPLWQSGAFRRKAAYQLLAARLNISAADCHIGMFDEKQCQKVVEYVPELQTMTLKHKHAKG